VSASIKTVSGDTVTLEVTVQLNDSMLDSEQAIQSSLNEAGSLATGEALKRFDTDGSRLEIGGEKWFSKGEVNKIYQTPYGEVELGRYVYQRSSGGKTFCPLERDARIVVTSTPRFAQVISHKFATGSSLQVQRDLQDNHAREVARSYLQRVADTVGSVAQAKEESWHYATPKLDHAVETVGLGIDGTCMMLCEEGYREAMTGTLSLYDGQGERLHTIYLGATPEYGKGSFFERMGREIDHIKLQYPLASYVGVADGAQSNWDFLAPHTETQILDFYHAAQYLADAAEAAFPRDKAQREQWRTERCHDLKHKQGAASRILKEMQGLSQQRLSEPIREKLEAAITYFGNHKHQMKYTKYRAAKYPIGSGVTEAACKTLVKQRLCQSGMRWKEKGASVVLSLRALVLTEQRWEQFWGKVNQYGFPVAA
jgi:hypothetical protein